jgi:hypothetical protein
MRNVRQKQTFSDGGNVSTRKPLTTPPPVNRSEPITVPQRRFPAQPVQAQERTNRAAMPEEPSRPDTQRVTAQQLRDNRPSLSGKNARSPTSYLQPGRDQFFTAPHHLLVDPENRRHGYYDKLDRNEQHSEKMSVAPVKLNKKALLEKTVYPPSGFPHPLLWALSSLSAPTASDSKPKITVSSTFDKRVKKQTAFSRLHRWVFPTPSPFPVPSTNSLRTKI